METKKSQSIYYFMQGLSCWISKTYEENVVLNYVVEIQELARQFKGMKIESSLN